MFRVQSISLSTRLFLFIFLFFYVSQCVRLLYHSQGWKMIEKRFGCHMRPSLFPSFACFCKQGEALFQLLPLFCSNHNSRTTSKDVLHYYLHVLKPACVHINVQRQKTNLFKC